MRSIVVLKSYVNIKLLNKAYHMNDGMRGRAGSVENSGMPAWAIGIGNTEKLGSRWGRGPMVTEERKGDWMCVGRAVQFGCGLRCGEGETRGESM